MRRARDEMWFNEGLEKMSDLCEEKGKKEVSPTTRSLLSQH